MSHFIIVDQILAAVAVTAKYFRLFFQRWLALRHHCFYEKSVNHIMLQQYFYRSNEFTSRLLIMLFDKFWFQISANLLLCIVYLTIFVLVWEFLRLLLFLEVPDVKILKLVLRLYESFRCPVKCWECTNVNNPRFEQSKLWQPNE